MTVDAASADTNLSGITIASLQIVEITAGKSGRPWLEQKLGVAKMSGADISYVSCNFEDGGPWAGVGALFAEIIDEMLNKEPDLVEKHAFELVQVLPQLRRTLKVHNPTLTDLAPNEEKVRNYAADRAFRIVHGLIDLLDIWRLRTGTVTPWVVACEHFDQAGSIGNRFFRELLRRRGAKLRITLIVGVSPGKGPEIRTMFPIDIASVANEIDGVEAMHGTIDPHDAFTMAAELEERIGDDRLEKQIHLSELIKLWREAKRPDKVIRWRYFGLSFFCNLGFYADALRYGDGLLEQAMEYLADDDHLRWWIIIKTLNANTGLLDADSGLNLAERAQRLAEDETKDMIDHVPIAWVIQLLYLTAMLHARYKQPRDLAKGEEYLERALAVILEGDMPEGERHFQAVFNRNGLAMIRSFQGRPEEALELCRQGLIELEAHLGAEQHRLHRSILNYNIAQVYVAIGLYEEALDYFSAAMAMDPNYSEYYNERASLHLRLGRLDQAEADYLQAIELSPPYFEVFTNLGQCYRKMGKPDEAIIAYTRALDLEAGQQLALLGRANVYELKGNLNAAIDDYSTVLIQDSSQWQALANRGALYYESQKFEDALADFNAAIELRIDEPDLYLNRSIVLSGMTRYEEAVQDLHSALSLNNSPEVADSLQSQLDVILQLKSQEEVPRSLSY